MNPHVDPTPSGDLPVDPELPEPEVLGQELPALARRARTPRQVLAAVAIGGALGGPVRYGLGMAFPTAPHTFPATTFVINVTGSFVLALLLVFILDIWPPTTYVRPFLCVGFLGAYTTFSTWMVDTDRLLAAGAYPAAAANVLLSLAAGIAATSLGLRASCCWQRAENGPSGDC
jgi:CrcB protein